LSYACIANISGHIALQNGQPTNLKAGSRIIWSLDNSQEFELWIIIGIADEYDIDLNYVEERLENCSAARSYLSRVSESMLAYRIVVDTRDFSVLKHSTCLIIGDSGAVGIGLFSVLAGSMLDLDEEQFITYLGAGLSTPDVPNLPAGIRLAGNITMAIVNIYDI
jgi:hypothetical protein